MEHNKVFFCVAQVGKWSRLPDAPHAILSSAVAADESSICIVGGWSKMYLGLQDFLAMSRELWLYR